MTNQQPQDLDARREPGASFAEREDEVSLRPYIDGLWRYRKVIRTALLVVLGLFATACLAAFVLFPAERIATIEFRVLFEGADRGQYPNGMKFNPTEIVSAPVLTEVFKANDLQRFGRYEDFKETMFILQSNPELDLLSYEYQAKLADTKLTPVDRARIEEEFRNKREALTDPKFALSLRRSDRVKTMPKALMEKILNDTLTTWAAQAAERKGAMGYDVPLFSKNILDRNALENEDYLVSVDMLRATARRLTENIDILAELPGASLVRTGTDGVSLGEVRAKVEDVVRFYLEPLLGLIRSEGISKNPRLLRLYAEGQLFQIQLEHDEAVGRVKAVQDSLREYMAQRTRQPGEARGSGGAGGAAGGMAPGLDTPALIPQFGESFLDRLVELSTQTQNSDVRYRQQLTDRIIAESERMVALQREAAYYQDLTNAVKGMAARTAGSDALVTLIRKRSAEAYDAIAVSLDQISSIYKELSVQNLNPSTLLFSVTGPFMVRTQRALSFASVALYGVLVFLLSVIGIPLACLVHDAFRREARVRGPRQTPDTV